jgi:hypothetical protein
MGFFGGFFGGGGSGSTSVVYTPANIANAATAETIRDQVIVLLEALPPTSLTRDAFRRYRNEEGADFTAWAEKNAAAAFRRFQVRQVGQDGAPDVSNTQFEAVELELEIRIAYPQTARYGAQNAMDRDKVRNQDWERINFAVGIYGRGNFSGTNDCTPLGAVETREAGGKIDFLVVTARFRYQRSTT